MQRDVATAARQESAKDGDPERTAGLARGAEDPDASPMRWRGALVIATAVMAGMAKAVTPMGTLDTISVATPPVAVIEMSSAPAAPAVRATTMAFHSPM